MTISHVICQNAIAETVQKKDEMMCPGNRGSGMMVTAASKMKGSLSKVISRKVRVKNIFYRQYFIANVTGNMYMKPS